MIRDATVVRRAVTLGRPVSLVGQAAQEVDKRLDANQAIAAIHLTHISVAAARVGAATKNIDWVRWALQLHERHGIAPSTRLVENLENVAPHLPELAEDVGSFLQWYKSSKSGETEGDLVERLERLSSRPAAPTQ